MKRKIIGIFFIIIFLTIGFCLRSKAASKDLDEIQDYTITVDMNEDGSMNIKYHIEWKVLDSTSEGPLEWVQIGVPNSHVDEVKKLTKNIKKAKYSYNYGNYVRVDFDKKYYAGETVTFEFSIKQSYMYNKNADGTCTYTFTPGWFEDIEVKNATIRWNSNNIIKNTNGANKDGLYLVWSKPLAKGEKISVQASYNQSTFKNLEDSKQAKYAKQGEGSSWIGIIVVLAIVAVIAITIGNVMRGTAYYRHSGFGYDPYYHYPVWHHHYGGFWRRPEEDFGGGRRRWLIWFMCKLRMCVCLCWRRTSWLLKKGFLWNKFEV